MEIKFENLGSVKEWQFVVIPSIAIDRFKTAITVTIGWLFFCIRFIIRTKKKI